ncbi:MAG: siphovirus Gp157 family protein [Propionibacteriaceae bacterium]|nr:siphovirus Gp157 family protein [Propionibacteriaceae bacterium]
MRLFEIVDGVQNLLELSVDRDTGEISEEGLAALDELELTLDEKLTNTALFLKGVEAERDAVKQAAQELSDRAKIHTRQADRLREYLRSNMERVGHEGLSDPRVKLGWRTSTAVVVEDGASLPVELLAVKTSPNKKAIGDLLKAGTEVEGCHLETRRNLQVK